MAGSKISNDHILAAFMQPDQRENIYSANMVIFDISFEDRHTWYIDELKYSESWDWLMPVWKKCIHEIGLWMMTNGHDRLWLEESAKISSLISSEVNVEKAHEQITRMINWYQIEVKSEK